MKSDIEIAQEATLLPIKEVAANIGIKEDDLELYGKYKAKFDSHFMDEVKNNEDGKLVLVTAINPTPAGEGKTTTSIGLAQALEKLGKKSVLALREPSLGPCFGIKGGAAGGGYSQVLPMENINLHFTGDFHAVTSAHNMITALLDNYIYQTRNTCEGLKEIKWKRVLDVNDRSLRNIVSGLGGSANGVPTETGFDITPASEIMAILCLATDLDDLRRRIENIILGFRFDGTPFTVKELGVAGAITVLLKDAINPNLVQTTEGSAAFVHGGPFANIAHGCNSILATKMAMTFGDYVVTEAGFGADLGAEKFLDIKCRMNGLWPNVIVLVATVRALKHHGGAAKGAYADPNPEALKAGMANLLSHVKNIREVWQSPVVVALNRFATDTAEELDLVASLLAEQGVACAPCNGWAEGGKGTTELAKLVCEAADANPAPVPSYTYPDEAPLKDKIRAVATRIYHAAEVSFAPQALKDLAQLEGDGYAGCPVCIAKTQYSMSDDASRLGAPEGYALTIRSARLSAGAGFVVAFAGSIIAMPGLPKVPAALGIDVDEQGEITGLF